MTSGSLKDLCKSITTSLSSKATLPLPEELIESINAYLDKHSAHDDSDSQKLQDELLNIYQSAVSEKPSHLAPFLAILQLLKPNYRGAGRLLQWWEQLAGPILVQIGVEKGLAVEARDILLGILVYDEDEAIVEVEAKATSDKVAENLLETWLGKAKVATEDLDEHARYVEGQIRETLMIFGRKRPQNFMNSLNKFFVKKNTRIETLFLLCEFFRGQPPHLHQMLSTPLFENLLRCLQMDTSTRVISLAMTALVMFLPNIPRSAASHLPALFNIYSRMLFWDRERKRTESQPLIPEDEKSEKSREPIGDGKPWDKMTYLLESDDEKVPELLHYYTFLYGLYPLNFMSYIRKPQRYLRHANFPGADDVDIEPLQIRERSEPFRLVHLQHPNFFLLTIESEINDHNRWMKSEAADVVAECMGLYVPTNDGAGQGVLPRGPSKNVEENLDVPDDGLLDDDNRTPCQSRHHSWRNTQSTAVASPDAYLRKTSEESLSTPSIQDSPSIRPSRAHDSPIGAPQMLTSGSHHQLSEMLGSQVSARGSLYQALTNESVGSLALSINHDISHMDAYLASLSRDAVPRSPSLRPTTSEPTQNSLKIAYLHREIQLLKNDLNFERYLKQQHLSHIGQLRRKQIREARIEAETQNLINANRGLKTKHDEAKRLVVQMKAENEKSKTHSRKWEADLTAKLRALREDQKKWKIEREDLTRDLQASKDDIQRMKQLVVESESQVLGARQKVQSVEASIDELERLRKEVEQLNTTIRKHEADECEGERAKENETVALSHVTMLEIELVARDEELRKSHRQFEKDMREMREHYETTYGRTSTIRDDKKKETFSQNIVDTALYKSRNRIIELQKAHNHLLNRYTKLQDNYLAAKEQLDNRNSSGNEAILPGSYGNIGSPSDPLVFEASPTLHNTFPTRSTGLGDGQNQPVQGRLLRTATQVSGSGSNGSSDFTGISPDDGSIIEGGSSGASPGGIGLNIRSEKIKSSSEVRIFGRGGVQNIGKKEKEKEKEKKREKEKEKEKDNVKDKGKEKDGAKDKRSLGIKGLRGFV